MSTAFTPGPWTFDGPTDNIIVWSSLDNRVCFLTSDGPTKANARLIAAAPKLYEALEQRPALPLVYDTVQLRDFNRRYSAWEEKVRAAIADARGEA